MKRLFAPLLAAACLFALPAYSQTPLQQDSTKNTDVPNKAAPSTSTQSHRDDKMEKKHSTKKSHRKSESSGASGSSSGASGSTSPGTDNSGASSSGASGRAAGQSPDTKKKEEGTPGK